jgi:hypothetical protein
VSNVTLYFLDDGRGIRPPLRYDIQAWRGNRWVPVPGQHRSPIAPTGRMANVVSFPGIQTNRLRVTLVPRSGSATGLTEIESWQQKEFFWDLSSVLPERDNLAWEAATTASFTSKYDSVAEINDMVVAFSRYSRNRWTAFGSPNASDWVQLDFPARQRVDQIELFLWGDGGGVKAPKRYTIQAWNGMAWTDAHVVSQVPRVPQVSSVNTVHIEPVTTEKVRVVFQHDLPATTGVTELKVWGHPE